MTLYEELYHSTPKLPKFYRFEGFNSFPFFNFQGDEYLTSILRYIYFSKSEKHHAYYVAKRLKQLISSEVLEGTGLKFDRKTLIDIGSYREIESCIESYSFENKSLSIEFSLSPLMSEMLQKNTVSNRTKGENDRRIEKVDYNTYGGGYGFCEEWLRVFNILTIFYSYHRITREDMLDYLYMFRRNLIKPKTFANPVIFLSDPKNRVIKINDKIYSDFSKYELMDALQKIVDTECYFKESIFAENPDEQIKRIVQEYIAEREQILDMSDSIYQRSLRKQSL